MRTSLKSDKAVLLLEATLDSFNHPVWITDANGDTLMNQQAQILCAQGFPLRNALSGRTTSFRGAKFTIRSRELNHGTNCFFHEYKVEDDVKRLKNCADTLESVIKNH